MDTEFWLQRWQKNETGFHQSSANELLVRHWPTLDVPAGSAVFVPLCGKSLDMAWLAAQGHRVIGSELSELAIDAFLSGERLAPEESWEGPLRVKRAGSYELWLGDFFALPPPAFRQVAAAYDRAALVAMPPAMQQAYADKLSSLLSRGAQLLLVALEYDPAEMSGPPFPVPEQQVQALFGKTFEIRALERRDGMPRSQNLKARGLSWLAEPVYALARR